MSWGPSVIVGVITAVVGGVASGLVAVLAVGWYHISSFEAKSAAFVIGFAILGLAVGFAIGVVASRVLVGGADPSFLRALAVSQAILLGLVAVVGVSARLLADVPPEINDEQLMLMVEVRWPEGHAESPATLPGEPFLRLGSVTRGSRTLRASTRGPLWTADARLVDGRWVAPGAVDIFTSRGRLVLDVVLGDSASHGFLIPLSGRPDQKDFAWTEWYPHARPGAPPLPNGFTYRYRVQPRSAPVRIDSVGPFEVATIASDFYDEQIGGDTRIAAWSQFEIRYRGQPIAFDASRSLDDSATTHFTRASRVLAIDGPRPALLAHFNDDSTGGACFLLSEEAGAVRPQLVPDCPSEIDVRSLTSDSTTFRTARTRGSPRGWLDRRALAEPGLYLVSHSVLDTRNLALHHFDLDEDVSDVPSLPPLALSPDERSFARFAYAEHSDTNPVLVVTDVVANRRYLLPIDPARMRYSTIETLDPPWVAHHFAWERGADGIDRLVERKGFVPLPYRGTLSANGTYHSYRLEPAGEELRGALVDFLVAEMKAERVPVDSGAYEYPLTIDGQTVNVACSQSSRYVAVTLGGQAPDTALLSTIARRFDAALATGRYDALFGR